MKACPKAALVTGAADRIGAAIAIDLARAGWRVGIHYRRSHDRAEALVNEIAAAGGAAVALQADLADERATQQLVSRATASLGPLGCLVNNAAHFEYDNAASATRASWDLHLETNLRAPFVLIQSFAEQLDPNASGVVINMLDQRVWKLTAEFVSYTLSKSGLWTLTRVLALALAPRIRVNAIGPGPTLPSPGETQQHFERQIAALPLGEATRPEQICAAVRFIISAESMTGQMIALDGGQHLGR